MTLRKRSSAVPPPALTKAVPYPPEAMWRERQEGEVFAYRGNTFKRQGQKITRVIAPAQPADA